MRRSPSWQASLSLWVAAASSRVGSRSSKLGDLLEQWKSAARGCRRTAELQRRAAAFEVGGKLQNVGGSQWRSGGRRSKCRCGKSDRRRRRRLGDRCRFAPCAAAGAPAGATGCSDIEGGQRGEGAAGESPGSVVDFDGQCGHGWAAPGGATPPKLHGNVTPQVDSAGNWSFSFGRYRLVVAGAHGARVIEFSIDGNNLIDANAGSTFWPSPQQAYTWPPPAKLTRPRTCASGCDVLEPDEQRLAPETSVSACTSVSR